MMASTPADDRREILTFVGFLALCGTTIAVVVIAKGSWQARQWAALGALAAVIQAIAVVTALVFAYGQIIATREAPVAARRAQLLDRLDTAGDGLERSCEMSRIMWADLRFWAQAWASGEYDEARVAARYTEVREEYSKIDTDLNRWLSDVFRALTALGIDTYDRTHLQLRTVALWKPLYVPTKIENFDRDDQMVDFDRLREAIRELRQTTNELLLQHAPPGVSP